MFVNRIRSLAAVAGRHSMNLLRVSLGLVFIWFGVLKITGVTPVADLVAASVPFVSADLLVPALGGFEVAVGLALLVGKRLGLVAGVIAAHLAGTFSVLVFQPDIAFQDHNPLNLTMTGEFVVKNVVLITAALVLATSQHALRAVEVAAPVAAEVPFPARLKDVA